MGLTTQEFNRLVDDLAAKEAALREHRDTGILVWRGDTPPDRKIVTIDNAWLDRINELRAERDAAERELYDRMARG